MERLSDTAIEIINELHTERLDYSSEYIPLIDAANRLAAYEDSGLEPEKVVFLKDIVEDAFRDKPDFTNHLRDLLQAEQDGRLVVLPKPSDTDVYIVYYDECGAGGMCLDYPYCDDCKEHTPKIREAKLNCTMVNSIGKTVFLTREEAEEVVAREIKRQIQVWIGGEN